MDEGQNLKPGRPAGDFKAFYQTQLVPQIGPLEQERKLVLRRILRWIALIVSVGVALNWFCVHIGASKNFFDFTILAPLFGVIAVLTMFRMDYDAHFKARVIRPLVAHFDSGLVYSPHDAVPMQVFVDSRLFPGDPPNEYTGEDLVAGTLGETAMCFSEVCAKRVRQDKVIQKRWGTIEIGDTRLNHGTIFDGVFFSADFNKNFSGATFVLPDHTQKLLGSMGQLLQSWEKDFGPLVKLEDPEFERAFVVYSDSQIESRYILTPTLMQRILDFRRRSQHPFRISFVGSSVNVAVDMHKDLFESRLFGTLLDPALYESFWHDLNLLAGIVEELNLNTRIWTKA